LVTATKLTKAEAGLLGARSRWAAYVPSVVRLDELTPPQRRLVLALVDAAKIEFNGKASAVSETPAEAQEARRAADEPS
jgi:hypothetical protein